MINIKETIKLPSTALQMMVDGIKEQSKRTDFIINMSTYGDADNNGICYGCAATCTIQKIAARSISINYIGSVGLRAYDLGFDEDELRWFEDAIDDARAGELGNLFNFFGLEGDHDLNYDDRFFLSNNSFECQLPYVESLIDELKENGL